MSRAWRGPPRPAIGVSSALFPARMVSATSSAVNVFPTPGGPLSWIIIPLPTNFALVGTLVSPMPRMSDRHDWVVDRCGTTVETFGVTWIPGSADG
jgi:hypothetical protein